MAGRNDGLYIRFTSPDKVLTYGPKSTDWLPTIGSAMKSNVGGYANTHNRIKDEYRIVWLGIPAAAMKLYELDYAEFFNLSGMPWLIETLGLTNFRFTEEDDWPDWDEERQIPMIDRTTNQWQLESERRKANLVAAGLKPGIDF